MNPYHHARSSAGRFGGRWEDYWPLHSWFDESKAHLADFRHRALRHHSEGIFLAERLFGAVITNSAGRAIPTRVLGEQHVKEDLGRIPTVQDWLECLAPRQWMMRASKPARATATGSSGICACQQPGEFCSGVPGILARIENGRLAVGTEVQRCDSCCRYPTDAAALAQLQALGLA